MNFFADALDLFYVGRFSRIPSLGRIAHLAMLTPRVYANHE